ncbi:MAG: alpha/beta hydrolase [Gammaproteobacteria bacterium]|nr:alpha/beta hydrolase [Gammaproteobacteria bacterium]NVK89070.1 alpha/beta hydrolase [Gammaproteobacteria bacterium]
MKLKYCLIVIGLLASVSAQANPKLPTSDTYINQCVVLLHGMGRTHRSMNFLQKRLQQVGFVTVNKSYASLNHPISELAEQAIPSIVAECPAKMPVSFVTHSLGGLIVRDYLAQHPNISVAKIVMLGPPNQGSEVAQKIGRWLPQKLPLFQRFLQISKSSSAYVRQLAPIQHRVGVIAGTRSLNPIFSSWLPGLDDGKVAVSDTCLTDMSDRILVEANHTSLLFNAEVIAETLYFLQYDEFSAAAYHFKGQC